MLIHLAAKIFVPESFDRPNAFLEFNFQTTLNALELTRKNEANFIFISSYMYGKPEYLPIDEKHPLAPHNPYAYSKLIGEQLSKCYYDSFNIPTIILRPFNLYGIGQNDNFLIPSIIKQTKNGKIELNDPRPKRDFLFIDDFIELVYKIITNPQAGFNIFNIGSGVSISVKKIVDIIVNFNEIKPNVFYKNEYRKNEVMDLVANFNSVKEIYQWIPKTTIEQGLKNLINADTSTSLKDE